MKSLQKIFPFLIILTIAFFSLNNFGNISKVLAQSCQVNISQAAVGDSFTVTATGLSPGAHAIRLATYGTPIDLGFIQPSPVVPNAHDGEYTIPASATAPEYQVQIDQGSGNWLGCESIRITTAPPPGQTDIEMFPLPQSQAEENFTAENLVGQLVSEILPIILGLAGFITVIIIVISGIQFVTSSGNPEAAAAARGRLTMALVGFIIIILAFAITQIVDKIFLGGSGVF